MGQNKPITDPVKARPEYCSIPTEMTQLCKCDPALAHTNTNPRYMTPCITPCMGWVWHVRPLLPYIMGRIIFIGENYLYSPLLMSIELIAKAYDKGFAVSNQGCVPNDTLFPIQYTTFDQSLMALIKSRE